MVEVSNNFIQECEANVGTYKFGKIKVNYIDDNPLNYEQGAYSSSNGVRIDSEQSIRYNKLVECEPNFKYKIELGNSAYKMKIVTYTEAQAFIAAHDNLIDGSELTTEATAKYISVTIYSNDTLEGTNITLNNTIRNGEILGAELEGNTTQDGTPTPDAPVEVKNVTGEQVVRVCGKNILPQDKYINNTTINGITFTNNGDGTFSASGTATADTSIVVIPAGEIELEANQSYYLYSSIPYNAKTFNLSITMTENNAKKYLTANNTYTPTTTPTQERLALWIPNGVSVNIQNAKIMLVRGTTRPTEYEKLQNKDYAINLGKNLYEGSQDFSGTWANSTSWSTAEETYNGLVVKYRQNAWNGLYKEIYVQRGDVYTFSFFAKKETGGEIRAYLTGSGVGATPNNKSFNVTTEWQRYSFTFTITTSCKLRARIENRNNDSITYICGYQLEKNNVMTSYSPYFEPIELNKIGTYQDYIRKGNGKNLVESKNIDSALSIYTTILCIEGDLKPSTTYAISFNGTNGNQLYPNENLFTTSSRFNIGTNRMELVLTTKDVLDKTNSAQYNENLGWRIFKNAKAQSNANVFDNLQIEDNLSVTYYEPYGYKDKWYIEKNVDKFILDKASTSSGKNYCNVNTTWDKQNEGYIHFQFPEIIVKYNDGDKIMIADNRFPSVTIANRNLKAEQIFAHYTNGVISITIETSRLSGITASSSVAEKRTAFNTWLTSNPITMYYVIVNPTYTLIENEELIEQLNAVSHAETQEGTTNITSSGILPAILEVTPNLIESIRGKQTTPIVGYTITGEDDLINFKITSKADSNGNILGATSQSQVDIEIFNENNTHNLENKQVYISTGLNETEGNYCKWQPFTITQTKDTQTKNHTTYTGYDDMMRGNEAYVDNIDYGEGITLYDFTCNLAKEMGMALENTTMTNGEFIVKGNNFTNNETKLVVLKNVAQMVGGFATIDRDNLLRIIELSPEDAMTPIELTTNLYTENFQNSAKFGEINEIAIGETNLETNAIVRSDEAAIAKDGVKKIEILDNLFLGMLEDKELAIDPLWDAFEGFNYYPFKTPYNGYPYLDLGDKINITDINSNVYGTLVLNNVFEYNGGYKGNIGAEALSITAAKYKTTNTLSKQFRKVGIDIDRVEGKITSEIATATDGITQAYNTAISQTEKNINLSVTEINKVLSGDPAVEGDTGLEGTVNKINQTYLTVDSNDFTVVSSTATEAKKKADAVEENTQKIVSQLHFDAETGLTISAEGSTDDDMKLNLTNSQVNFMYRNSPVLVINGNKIEFTGATFQKFDLGNYVWQAEDDDSLSLIYEGD